MPIPKHLLKMRCTILRMQETNINGAPAYDWVEVKTKVRCFLDLSFQRPGKDPGWTPEAGRPADRSGVWFGNDEPLKPGDRVVITSGSPSGTFEVLGAIDTVPNARTAKTDHMEAYVQEVAQAVA